MLQLHVVESLGSAPAAQIKRTSTAVREGAGFRYPGRTFEAQLRVFHGIATSDLLIHVQIFVSAINLLVKDSGVAVNELSHLLTMLWTRQRQGSIRPHAARLGQRCVKSRCRNA